MEVERVEDEEGMEREVEEQGGGEGGEEDERR